jgi:hypothetical protein
MLIDKFDDQWLDRLNAQADRTADTSSTYLLIDGVFVPGFYRRVNASLQSPDVTTLLFESLPSCSETTRSVSPFIVPYSTTNRRLQTLLAQCSGWPMVSSVETTENQAALTARLGAWCVVEADNSRFNLRFPDTRRLPGIFKVLTAKQQLELCGPATRWSYINRYGSWAELAVPEAPSAMADRPKLGPDQFAELVSASEVDEVISILATRGCRITGRLSHTFTTVSIALRVAKVENLDPGMNVDWCEGCLANGLSADESAIGTQFQQWRASRAKAEDTSP